MKRLLKKCKGALAASLKVIIIKSPLPLGTKYWATKTLLPMDPWPKSLVYQQCLADRVLKQMGPISQRGPFKGMRCLADAEEGCLVPKLFGCYEEELSPSIEALLRKEYDRFIEIGCASGYFLTGFALRMPRSELFGFDLNQDALRRCSELLALNNAQSRVKLSGLCTPGDFEELIQKRTLLFMDCDGPEYDLLDLDTAHSLSRCDIIVECHDYLNPKITPTLLERFQETHIIENISSRPRIPSLEKYPGLKALPRAHWPAALDERRPAVQNWLIMRSRHLHSLEPLSEVGSNLLLEKNEGVSH
jgi:SAM-dependent methyltransferase